MAGSQAVEGAGRASSDSRRSQPAAAGPEPASRPRTGSQRAHQRPQRHPQGDAATPSLQQQPGRAAQLGDGDDELAPEALTTPSAPGRARENLPLGRLLPTRPIYLAQWSQGLSNPRVLRPRTECAG